MTLCNICELKKIASNILKVADFDNVLMVSSFTYIPSYHNYIDIIIIYNAIIYNDVIRHL